MLDEVREILLVLLSAGVFLVGGCETNEPYIEADPETGKVMVHNVGKDGGLHPDLTEQEKTLIRYLDTMCEPESGTEGLMVFRCPSAQKDSSAQKKLLEGISELEAGDDNGWLPDFL